MIDGKVISIPKIAAEINDGGVVIPGGITEEEARSLAERIVVR